MLQPLRWLTMAHSVLPQLAWRRILLLGSLMALMPATAWARVFLDVTMTLGLSVSPDYWYIIAISRDGSLGPTANLTDPNIALGVDDVAFVENWDYLIRIKPAGEDVVLDATIQEPGGVEDNFISGFNSLDLIDEFRGRDTIQVSIDLEELDNLDAVDQDIQVALLTIDSPFLLEPDETNLALDATRGDVPHYYRLSLSETREIRVDDPQRQETILRSRQLLTERDLDIGLSDSIEATSLGILAANLLTFSLRIDDR